MGWEWREHNRAKVLAHLRAGEYEAIVTTQQEALDTSAPLNPYLNLSGGLSKTVIAYHSSPPINDTLTGPSAKQIRFSAVIQWKRQLPDH